MDQQGHDFMTQSSRALAQTWGYPRHRWFVDQVRTAATAWFRSKELPVNSKYPYILAEWGDWPKNIILTEVAKYIGNISESQRADGLNFPLHKYIHHGLSSQAMLFNLAGPLLVRNDLLPLRNVIERKGLEWPDGETRAMFEYEDRNIFNEDSGQPTSLYWIPTTVRGSSLNRSSLNKNLAAVRFLARVIAMARTPPGTRACATFTTSVASIGH